MTVHHAYNYQPEPPIDPPYPDEAEYARNLRNGIREEICGAIDLMDSLLFQLDPKGHLNFIQSLAELRDYLVRDAEI